MTGDYDDLPLIRCKPVPTDAELAAERDVKYRALLAQESARGCGCTYPCACDEWPVRQVAG